MPNQIFPSSITQFSTENLIKKHSVKSKAIYWLLIISLIIFSTAIFWIKVDVNIHSRGIITSREKATQITAPVFGTVHRFSIKENALINRGDTLMVIDTTNIKQSLSVVLSKKNLLEQQCKDLQYLTTLNKRSRFQFHRLSTSLYKQELQKFQSDLRFQKSEIAILEKEFNRLKILFQNDVIPQAEYEQITYKLENARLRYQKMFDSQLSAWQNQLSRNNEQIFSLLENLNNLQKELEKHFVISPIRGYSHNLQGVKKEGTVYPNEEICIISPATHLIVEVYVSTMDIGLIMVDQDVRFRVDAFNFNQWGMLDGKVMEIAKDITVKDNGIPTFKIRCGLETTELKYHNKTVNVKKGMTVNANFFLMQRTLSQLFYDKVTDWLDPNQLDNN